MVGHSCTIFPCYLGMDNQCKDPMNDNKDCRVGQLTRDLVALKHFPAEQEMEMKTQKEREV